MQPQGPDAASSDPLSMFDSERRPARVVPGPGARTTGVTEPRRTNSESHSVAKAPVRRVATVAPVAHRATASVCERDSKHGKPSSWANGALWFFAGGAAFGSALGVFLVLQITGSQLSVQDPFSSPSVASQADETPLYGSLAIDSSPVVARAYVNGSLVGLTPLVLPRVPVGSRVIRLEANNHAPWVSTVRIVADQQTRVGVTLSPTH